MQKEPTQKSSSVSSDTAKPYKRKDFGTKKVTFSPKQIDSTGKGNKAIDRIRDWYYTSLLVCFMGIIGCYSGYAYLQESLLSDKEKKLNTNFVMGVQSVIAVLISSAIIKGFNMGELFGDLSKGDVTVGALNFMTMYCSNFALKFVNYPFMVLAKSAKILPVILTGWLTGVYKLTIAQVGIALTISIGLVIFNSAKVKKGGFTDDSPLGIFLVLLSLLFDGFVNSQTDKNHKSKQGRGGFAYHTMLYNNMIGLIGNVLFFAFTLWSTEDSDAHATLAKMSEDWNILREVILIGLCGAFGQIFIFLTISLHDCYKLSIITTTRKCVSVVVSAFAFNHAFTHVQWFGASLVLASTCLEVYLGNKRKREQAQKRMKQKGFESASTADESTSDCSFSIQKEE